MLFVVGLLMWAAVILAAVGVARDVKNIRRYKQERKEADALASQAVGRLIVGDTIGATRLAHLSRQHESKALDIMESW